MIARLELSFTTARVTIKHPQSPVEYEKDELEAITAGTSTADDAALTQHAILHLAIKQQNRSKQLLMRHE